MEWKKFLYYLFSVHLVLLFRVRLYTKQKKISFTNKRNEKKLHSRITKFTKSRYFVYNVSFSERLIVDDKIEIKSFWNFDVIDFLRSYTVSLTAGISHSILSIWINVECEIFTIFRWIDFRKQREKIKKGKREE